MNATPLASDSDRHLRISRLLKGARADLESAERAQAAGWTRGMNRNEPIDAEIARLRGNVAMWEGKLAAIGGAS